MATDRDFIGYVTGQAALGERLAHKKMFGENALYVDGGAVPVAGVPVTATTAISTHWTR